MNRILPTVVACLLLQIAKLKKILMQFSQIDKDIRVWSLDKTRQEGKSLSKSFVFSMVFMMFLLSGSMMMAQTNTWNGSSSTSWNTGANWSQGHAPTSSENVIIGNINPNGTNWPVLAANVTVNSLSILGRNGNSGNRGGSLIINTGFTLTVSTNLSITGSTGGGTGSLILGITANGTASISVGGNVTTTNSTGGPPEEPTLILNAGTLTVGGNLAFDTTTTFTAGTSTVVFNGATGTQTINNTAGANFNNITKSGAGMLQLLSNVPIVGDLNVSAGTLDLSTFTANRTATGGALTVAGTLLIGGTSNFPSNFTTFTNTGGTVNYDNSGNQTIAIKSYNNLILSGSGIKTFGTAVAVAGNLSISGTATVTFNAAGNTATTLTLGGVAQNSGTWGGTSTLATNINTTYFNSPATPANKFVTVSTGSCAAGYWTGVTSTDWNTTTNWCGNALPTSATNVVIPAGTPNMPTISGITAVVNNLTINASATLTLANSVTSLLNISGDFTNNGTFTATGTTSTINFVGTTQAIGGTATTFSNLNINSGVSTMGVGLTINGNLNIASGATLATANNSLNFKGNFTNNGIFTAGSSTITMSGTIAQSISGFTTTGFVSMTNTGNTVTFTGNVNGAGLTINGTGGTLNLGTALTHTITGNVTLSAGTLNGGSSLLNVNATSATAWNGTGTVFTAGTSTVNFGGVNQTIATATTFNNLTLSGGGTKTFGATTTINNNLSIATGVSANLGTGFTHSAGTLTLGGYGTAPGYWGSTTATTATNQNDTYFSAVTGRVNVGSATCSAISATLSGSTSVCNGGSSNLVVTMVGGSGLYKVVYSNGSANTTVNSYVSGANIPVTTSSTTTYTLVSVSDANGCTATTAGSAIVTVSSSITTSAGSYTFCIDNSNTITTAAVKEGQYVLVDVIKGFNYTFSVGNVFTGNEIITVLDDATNANVTPTATVSGASGASISWTASLSGKVKVLLSSSNCANGTTGGTLTLTLNSIGNTQDDQTIAGTDTWVGHIYNAGGVTPEPFLDANYAGYYNISSETINEGFGGNTSCFAVNSNGTQRASIYTEGYAVRYRMKSTRAAGCYLITISGDDGVRLSVDGVKVFDQWQEQSVATYGNVLVYLNGNSNLILDYYENAGANQVNFTITPFDSTSNSITAPSPSTVCSGVTPGLINGSAYTYNGATVNPTIKYQWQLSSDNLTWTDISGATSEDYTPPSTTTTGVIVKYYRRVVSAAASNASACSWNSNSISIVTAANIATSAPTLAAISNLTCSSFTANWNSVATATSYKLDVSTNASFSTFVTGYNNLDIGLVTSFNISGLSNTTLYYYRIRAYNGCSGSTSANSSSNITTVSPIATISGATTVCQGATAPNITFTNALSNAITVIYNVNGGTNASINIAANSTATVAVSAATSGSFMYNLVSAAYQTAPTCSSTITGSATVTVRSAFTSGAINTTGETICNGGTPVTAIGSATAASGGDTTITYSWRSSADGYTSAISGATSVTYLPPSGLTTTTSYRRYAKDGTCSTTATVSTGTWTVTVRSAFTSGSINTTGETICNGGTPVTAIGSATAASGGDTTITYSWRSSADGYTSAISGATSATYLPPSGLTTTTSYQRYAKDGTCNTTATVSTGTWTVTVRSAFTSGSINTTGETICNGGTPVTAIGSATAASGGDTTITYSWRSSADGYTSAISGATSATYLPPSGLTTTTSYQRYAKDGTCNTIPLVSTGTWTVTVRSAFTSGAINTTGETICNGGTPVTAVGSATAASGGDTTITYSWRSSADGYTSAISGATSATYLPPSGLTTTTSYQRYAKDGTCNTIPLVSTGTWTVTVRSAFTSGAINTTGETICNGGTPVTAIGSATAASGGDTTITYSWRSSADGYTSAISGATSATYLPPSGLTTTTSYQRYAKDGTCNTTATVSTGTWTVTVRSAFTSGAINTTGETICNGGTPVTAIGSATAAGGGDTTITYSWRSSADGYTSAISGATSATYLPPSGLTTTISYQRYAKDGTCNTTATVSTGTWTVTVRSAFTSGAINTTGETICNGGTPVTAIGSATAASGGDTTITYSWRSSADGYTSAILGATSATYLPPSGLTTTTSYRRYAKDGTCSTTATVSTGTWTVTVRSAFTSGSINTTGETICNGGTPVTAIGSATAASGGDTTITYSWRSSADGYTSAISGATSATYLPPSGLTTTTTYQRYAKDGTCNTIPLVSTGTWTVTVRSAFTSGSINTTGETICNGGTPVTAIGSATAASGGDTTITYSWRSSADGYTSAISGATSATYLPPSGLTTTTSYRRYAKDGTCITTATVSTGTCTVTVNPNLPASVSIAASPTGEICSGTSVTFTATPTNGGTTPTYQWRVNGGNVGTNSSTYTNSVLVNGDVVTCIMTSNATPCLTGSPTTSNTITMIVSSSLPAPAGISVNGSAPGSTHTYCASTSAVLSIAAVANATSYFWDLPSDWTLVSGQGTTSVTVITGHAPTSNVSVFANNICGYSGASSLAIALSTIPPTTPTVTLVQTDCSNPTGGITVTKPAPSSGIIYTVTGTNPVVSAISNSTGVFTGLSVGDYTVTYQNGAGCVSSSKSVSIGATNTNTWDGTKWSKTGDTTPPTSGDVVVFNGNYSLNSDIEGCSCKVNAGFTVTIASGKMMTITNGVSNGGTLIFEDGASLVQYNDAAINTGQIIYKRVTSPMKNFDFTYWSSPVKDQVLNVLSPNTLFDKYLSYASSSWVTENGSNAMNPAGKGFIIRVPKPNSTYPNGKDYWTGTTYSQPVEFVGVPYNGNITFPTQGAGQFNLLGNPYPSAIDADLFLLNNSSVLTGALYFWTHNTVISANGNKYVYSSNDYATYNLTGGTAATSPGIGASNKPFGKIAACQSFFVVSNAIGNFEFTNSMRAFGSNSQFFKMSNTKKTSKVEKNRVWLNLTNSGGAFKQLLVGYITDASNDLDNLYDGVSINGNTYVDFYSVNSDKNLSIQGRALPFNPSDEVPLGYKTSIEGSFDISIDNVDGVLTNQTVYLQDKVTNVLHNLKDGAYTFTTLKGEFKDRFVLRYTDGTKLGTSDFNAQGKSVIVSVKNHQIKVNSFDETIASVMVYDLKGSLLYENKKIDKNEFIIQNLMSSDQFLIVLTQLASGVKVTQEVIFQN